jgi:hypothetical protein
LDGFYGPFMQMSQANHLVIKEFRSRQPAGFRPMSGPARSPSWWSIRSTASATLQIAGEDGADLLAPLAFLSPRIVAAIVDGTAPTDLTVTGVARALPYSWAEQEQRIGFSL